MPGKPRLSVDAIRQRIRARLESSTLRELAQEIGLSKSSLEEFLKGRAPYSKTRLKLAAWNLRQGGGAKAPVRREDVEAAVAVLQHYIEGAATERGRAERVREVTSRVSGEARET